MPSLEGYGDPDAVYLAAHPPGGHVVLVYAPRPGLPEAERTGVGMLIGQFTAVLEPNVIEKLIHEGTRVTEVDVAGARGYWLEGAEHVFVSLGPGEGVWDDRVRLAGNVLMWESGDVVLRLEADISRNDALRIAESMRPAP